MSTHLDYDVTTDPTLSLQPVPVSAWIVTSVTDSNGLSGSMGRTLTKTYSYSSPVYDPRERAFIGFGRVSENVAGAAGDPGLLRRVTFLNEACSGTTCENRPDYSYYLGLRGLPAVVEDSSNGVMYRTTVNKYEFNWTYATTLGGRLVLSRYLSDQRTFLWGQQTATTGTTFPTSLGDGGPSVTVSTPTVGTELRHTWSEDAFGNVVSDVDFGKVGADRPILTTRSWALPSGDATEWSYRPTTASVSYADPAGHTPSGPVRTLTYVFDPNGRLTSTATVLSGSQSLARSNPGGQVAPAPLDASADGPVTLSEMSYDPYGNVRRIESPGGRCYRVQYDDLYAEFPKVETSYLGGCGSAAALTTSTIFDRGFGASVQTVSAASEMTVRRYDPFGRLQEVDQQSDAIPAMTDPAPALQVQYLNDDGPVRIVFYRTVTGTDDAPTYQDHYEYIDAFGDALAKLDRAGSPSDGTPSWIVS
ncbi:MAG: toxin TcdB middle/N-terminal domain-containing protein, partial [Polyangiaceae bacterium]